MIASRLPLLASSLLLGILIAGELARVAVFPWETYAALATAIALARFPLRSGWLLAVILGCVGAARFSAHEHAAREADARVRAAARAGPRVVEGEVRAIRRRGAEHLSAVITETQSGAHLALQVFEDDVPLPELLPGDRIRARGRLQPAQRYRLPRWRHEGPRESGTLSVDSSEVEILAAGSSWVPRRWAARTQSRLVEWVRARDGPERGKAVLRAALTGDRGGMPDEVTRALRDAGAAHILAVSGLHLAAVAGLTFLAARKLVAAAPAVGSRFRPARAAALVAAPVAILYTLVTGAHTSTVRALVMTLVALGGIAFDRRPRGPQALALAALALAVAAPHAVYRPAFQLSFAAAAALVFGGARRASGRGLAASALGALRSLARASVITAAATAPFTALAFGQVALAGVVTNTVAVPLVSALVLPLGLAAVALAPLWPAGGALFAEAAAWVAAAVVQCSAAVARWIPPWQAPPPTAFEVAALAAGGAALIAAARGVWSRRVGWTVFALALACVAGSAFCSSGRAPRAGGELRITFVEVGQGDASVLEFPSGEVWLVDAGGVWAPGGDPAERRRRAAVPGERAVLEYLRQRRISALDRVVLSHAHADHYAGLFAIAEAMPVRELWIARPHADTPPSVGYRGLVASLAAGGTRIVYPRLDHSYRRGGLEARVLSPRFLGQRAAADPVYGANENSLVVTLEYGGRRVLFAGDVEREAEARLLRRDPGALAADVVKVPHHGSATSSSAGFAAAVAPGWAIVSCGLGNRFGMPDADAVRRWQAAGARLVSTAEVGSVTATIGRGGEIDVVVADPRGAARGEARRALPAPRISLW